MKLVLIILILGIFAVIGSRLSYFNRTLTIGFRNIIFTGIEYIFAGILLGQLGLDILDRSSIVDLQPLLTFGMCWVGFLLGLQLRSRELRKMPRYYFSITLITAVTTFGVVLAMSWLIVQWFFAMGMEERWLFSLVLASISVNTAQSALAIISKNCRIRRYNIIKLLRYISGMDGVMAILLFSLATAIIPPRGIGVTMEAAHWTDVLTTLALSLLLGLVGAGILYLLTRARFTHNEFILFLVGVTLFFGGISVTGNLSPLLTGLVCGAVFANISNKRMQAISVVIHSEKAIYIIMLLMLGALWNFSLDTILLVGLLYLVFRMGGKVAGALLGTKLFRHPTPIPSWLGLGLISEGGLSIVMVLSFKILYPVFSDVIVSVVVVAAIVNELISPSLILSLFPKSEREIRPLNRREVRPE